MRTEPPNGSSPIERIPAYILAGGKSRRFGSDKARAVIDGSALVSTIARTITPFVASVTVVAARGGHYDDLGLRTIGDLVPDKGPLGGLLTAINDRREGWLLLLSCDWVGIRGAWVDELVHARSAGALAVAFHTDRFEPLFALYHTEIRPVALRHLERDELTMQTLLAEADAGRVPVPADWFAATNQNVPPQSEKDG